MIYEHLGNPITDDLFEIHEIVDYLNKPRGGLWGSRLKEKDHKNENTKDYYTWREWVERNMFHPDLYLRIENQYKFRLKECANVFVLDGRKIDPEKDMLDSYNIARLLNYDENVLRQVSGGLFNRTYNVDWEYLMDEYDGFELIHGNCHDMFHSYTFNSWDCDSIVIWNKDAVEVIR